MSIALIIVTYNRLETLKQNLEHVGNQSKPPDAIIIVNNNSTDGTADYLDSRHDLITLHQQGNIGWSGGLEIGMKYAHRHYDPDYYWLMDDDSFPGPNTLALLFEQIEKLQKPSIIGLLGYTFRHGMPVLPEPSDELKMVDFVLVDNALISKEVVKVAGYLDPDFFIMAEDYEYCKRARHHGFDVWLYHTGEELVNRLHLGSQIFSKPTLWRGYYHTRNHILTLKKFFSWKDFFGFLNRHTRIILYALIFAKDRKIRVKLRLMGLWDGILGRGGKLVDPMTLKRV